MVKRHAVHVQPAHRVSPPQPCAACKLERVVAPPQCCSLVPRNRGRALHHCLRHGVIYRHIDPVRIVVLPIDQISRMLPQGRKCICQQAGMQRRNTAIPTATFTAVAAAETPGATSTSTTPTPTTTLLVVTDSNCSVAFIACAGRQVRVSNHVVKGRLSILDGVSCPPQTELVDIVQLSGHKTQPTGPALLCLAAGGTCPNRTMLPTCNKGQMPACCPRN